MSLRPQINGFDLNKMSGLFGSQDEQLLGSMIEEFDRRVSFRHAPHLVEESHLVLRRAIFEGYHWPDLEFEREPHVFSAIILAEHEQEHLRMQSDSWKFNAFHDLATTIHDFVPQEIQRYLVWLVAGRPIFGRRIKTGWSFYGFLSNEKLKNFRLALVSVRQSDVVISHSEGFIRELLDQMIGWFEEIEIANLDLWFYWL